MSESLPPQDRKLAILAEKAIDIIAIIGIVLLSVYGKLDSTFAASLIALIAGTNIGQVLNRTRGGSSGLIIGIADIILNRGRG